MISWGIRVAWATLNLAFSNAKTWTRLWEQQWDFWGSSSPHLIWVITRWIKILHFLGFEISLFPSKTERIQGHHSTMLPHTLHISSQKILHYTRSHNPITCKIASKPWGKLDISAFSAKNYAFTVVLGLPHLLDIPILVLAHSLPKNTQLIQQWDLNTEISVANRTPSLSSEQFSGSVDPHL